MGSSMPTRTVSLATHVGLWNGAITIGALFDYHGGYRIENAAAAGEASNFSTLRAQNVRGAPLWLQARAVEAVLLRSGPNTAFSLPSGFFEDGTFVRFRELSLTYALPVGLARLARVQSLSLTGAVRNLALWTRYTGVDPESSDGGGGVSAFSSAGNSSTVNNDVRIQGTNVVPLPRYWVVRLNIGI
jgi:hypothetical protein